jgi:uncharacterized membrane protein
MKPLVILIAVFVVSLLVRKSFAGEWNPVFSGNLAMCAMFCLTGLAHFKFTDGMTMMIPGAIPLKREIVYLTGFAEILLGLGLLFPPVRYLSGVLLVILLVMMLPANIRAAFKHINYEKANYDGPGPGYLWFRIPLQLFFVGWIVYFSLKSSLNESGYETKKIHPVRSASPGDKLKADTGLLP